jgi:hypothetical protein
MSSASQTEAFCPYSLTSICSYVVDLYQEDKCNHVVRMPAFTAGVSLIVGRGKCKISASNLDPVAQYPLNGIG